MNRFTVRVLPGTVRGDVVSIKSTLDRTCRLAIDTDEAVVVGPDDVTVIKNTDESSPAVLELKGMGMRAGRIICRPSRQESFVLFNGRTMGCTLGPGEAMVIRAEGARDPAGDTTKGIGAV